MGNFRFIEPGSFDNTGTQSSIRLQQFPRYRAVVLQNRRKKGLECFAHKPSMFNASTRYPLHYIEAQEGTMLELFYPALSPLREAIYISRDITFTPLSFR